MAINMKEELLFARKLEEIKKTAKMQGNCVSEEQVREFFSEWKLDGNQYELVKEYLLGNKIGIGESVNLDDYLTEEEINYLDGYLEELEHFDSMTAGEREAVTLAAMAGDEQAQSRLVDLFLPQVAEIAKLYSGQGVFLEDLIGEGNLAVVSGVTMLGCMEHAKDAEGMLAKIIMDAMEEYIEESNEERQKDRKVLDRVNKVAQQARELAESLQRKVSVEELAQESGLSPKTIMEAVRMSGNKIEDIADEEEVSRT